MFSLLLALLVVLTEVIGGFGPHAHQHRRSSRSVETPYTYETQICSDDHFRKITEDLGTSNCLEPKEVFVALKSPTINPLSAYEVIIPPAVWVKRCVGHCHSSNISACVPVRTHYKHIPVRIYNTQTQTERCATVVIEEDRECHGMYPYDPVMRRCRNHSF